MNVQRNQFVSVADASILEGYSDRTIMRKIAQGKINATTIVSAGRVGKTHLIPLSELSVEAQLRHHQQAEGVNAQSADLSAYRERYGEAGLEKVMARLRAVQEMQLLRGDKRSAQRRAGSAGAMGGKPRCTHDWGRE